jgi:hypothetical protein
MTEAEKLWLATNDHPRDLMELVEGNPFTAPLERRWRLFLCGWARRVAHLADQQITQNLIAAAEQYADGELSSDSIDCLRRSVQQTMPPLHALHERSRSTDALYAALATAFQSGNPHTFDTADYAVDCAASASGNKAAEWAAQAAIIKDIFGNPFRPVSIDPAWLNWNGGTVPKLAQAIHDQRHFADLPILADALEEAGCDDADVLDHCRSEGPHVRGCWVIDLLLGKE